ncbi:MAG: cob(I)yrinic acid a,c-diamide adenosyltransferase [Methanobacteriota archaeon]|nr:MAG: cob(I)yrinic acid a,c-diamide adenosyltransferase [Euryarchaeota archaeon]
MPDDVQLGRVHVITGPGKGKTTAAFGLAMRAAGHGLRVCVVQFMKSGGSTGEVLAAEQLKRVRVAQFGTGKFVGGNTITKEDQRSARKAVKHALGQATGGRCDLLVLDEVNVAVFFGLISAKEIIDILEARSEGVEVVLTGRNAPDEFIQYADYVSHIDTVKHPFEKGSSGRKGIEW